MEKLLKPFSGYKAALIAVLVGYLTESVIATILSGLAVLWLLIFFI